jgi:enoyl-CoA hydratase/carnithine racemase
VISRRTELAVTLLSFARADKKNALTSKMLGLLAGELESIGPDTGAIVLAGEGDCFCAGFDLALGVNDPKNLEMLLVGLSGVMLRLRRLEVPVVVAAHGAAVAGGCALLGAADLVVADAGAKLGYPVLRLGLSPAVTAPFLAPAIGAGPAREKLLGQQMMSGSRAHELGLVHELVPAPADVLPRALALAKELAAKPRHAVAATKRWLSEIDHTAREDLAIDALAASMDTVGTQEQRTLLAKAWSSKP